MKFNQRKTSSTQPAPPKEETSQTNNKTLASIFGTLLSSQVSDTHHHTTSAAIRGNHTNLTHPTPPTQIAEFTAWCYSTYICVGLVGVLLYVNPPLAPSPNRRLHRAVRGSGAGCGPVGNPEKITARRRLLQIAAAPGRCPFRRAPLAPERLAPRGPTRGSGRRGTT
jgi:hypothetical protein